jgi:hypothetical protein
LNPRGRIEAKQSGAPFRNLDQKHSGRDVLVHESLVAKSRLQFVQLNQLHRKRSLEEFISVQLNRVVIERCIHLIDRAAMILGDAPDAFVCDLVVVHWLSLPLSSGFANADAAPEVVDYAAEVLDQLLFLGADLLDDTLRPLR